MQEVALMDAVGILQNHQDSLDYFDDAWAVQKIQNVICYLTAPREYAGIHNLYGSLELEAA